MVATEILLFLGRVSLNALWHTLNVDPVVYTSSTRRICEAFLNGFPATKAPETFSILPETDNLVCVSVLLRLFNASGQNSAPNMPEISLAIISA